MVSNSQHKKTRNTTSLIFHIFLFANIAKTPATLEPLQIDIFGNILNWPENFFGDEMGDITEQAKAAMKKRMQKTEKPEAPE